MSIINNFKIFLSRLLEKFQRDRCLGRASALASMSLIALVPLLALMFWLFSAFGAFQGILEEIQGFLVKQFLPANQEAIMSYITKFIDNTQALGFAGLLFFLITAVFLFNSIQNNFTDIWGSSTKTFSLHRIATYVSILIVGSFLLSMGLNFTEMLKSLIDLSGLKNIGNPFSILLRALPLIILFFTFLLLIMFLPGGRVYLKSGLIGAITGTILWEIAKNIFFFLTRYVIKVSIIYGSLAAIPILLLWLNTAWVIVLLSLEITYVHQYWKTSWFSKTPGEMNPKEKILLGLEIYFYIARRFFTGDKPVMKLEISEDIHISMADISFFIDSFYKDQLILFTDEYSNGIIPSKSLDKITLLDIIQCIMGESSESFKTREEILKIYGKIMDSIKSSIGNMSVMDYFNSESLISEDASKKDVKTLWGLKVRDSKKPGLSVSKRWKAFKSSVRKKLGHLK